MSVTTTIYGLCGQVTSGSPMRYELRFDAASQSKFYKIMGTPTSSGGLITVMTIDIKDSHTSGYESCTTPIHLGESPKRPNNTAFNGDPTSNCYSMPSGVTEVLQLTTTNGGTHDQDKPYNDSSRG